MIRLYFFYVDDWGMVFLDGRRFAAGHEWAYPSQVTKTLDALDVPYESCNMEEAMDTEAAIDLINSSPELEALLPLLDLVAQ